MKTIPNVADIAKPDVVEPIKQVNPMDSIVNSMISRTKTVK